MNAVYRKCISGILFPMVVFLFFGFPAVFLFPYPGTASSDATAVTGSQSGEERASFDEDAVAGSETDTNVSPLLHADQYQSAVYSPDRQVRSVVSTPWIRGLPFAALVILALVVSRVFKTHRHNRKFGAPAVFEKAAAIVIAVLLIPFTGTGIALAQRSFGGQGGFQQWGGHGRNEFQSQIYATVEDSVSSLLGADREIYQKTIDITDDVKQMLKSKCGWTPDDSSIKAYYSKTREDAVEAYAFVLTELLPKCGGAHKYCIKVSANGEVGGVQILELNCHHSYGVNSQWFLDQFKGVTAEHLGNTRIDAVTRATLSSDLTKDVVLHALALFEVAEGRTNV